MGLLLPPTVAENEAYTGESGRGGERDTGEREGEREGDRERERGRGGEQDTGERGRETLREIEGAGEERDCDVRRPIHM